MISKLPWRTGRKVYRTIYNGDGELIGVMDHAEDAALVVKRGVGRVEGAHAERAAIVEWLREHEHMFLADAIEAGEHYRP